MRAVAIAVGLQLPVACWAPPSWALSQYPAITTHANGQIGVHLPVSGSCTASRCSSAPGSPLGGIARSPSFGGAYIHLKMPGQSLGIVGEVFASASRRRTLDRS